MYNEYSQYSTNDLQELDLLLQWLKIQYPNLLCKVIFIQQNIYGEPLLYEHNNNIIILRKIIKDNNEDYKAPNILDIFYQNIDFIKKNI